MSNDAPDIIDYQVDWDSIQSLAHYCRDSSVARGFGIEGDSIRARMDAGEEFDDTALRNYYANRLMLIVGEVSEAHEELRKGHSMDDVYYTRTEYGNKPEGIPSELADIVIRVFDLAGEVGIDIADSIREKLTYNAERPFMHGKKF